jgi:hypothetical protein
MYNAWTLIQALTEIKIKTNYEASVLAPWTPTLITSYRRLYGKLKLAGAREETERPTRTLASTLAVIPGSNGILP